MFNALDADTIDALIFTSNQLRQDPEERLEEYLQQCAQQWIQDNPGELERALRTF